MSGRLPHLTQGWSSQISKLDCSLTFLTRRFQAHVAFDGIVGETTKVNLPAITLNVKHKGFHARKRSRTFMAGVDENSYSNYALQWLLDELVDDGDEVVCLRVIEREPRPTDRPRENAQALMKTILAKNGANRAISVVLEYAFGKVTSTFQKMVPYTLSAKFLPIYGLNALFTLWLC